MLPFLLIALGIGVFVVAKGSGGGSSGSAARAGVPPYTVHTYDSASGTTHEYQQATYDEAVSAAKTDVEGRPTWSARVYDGNNNLVFQTP